MDASLALRVAPLQITLQANKPARPAIIFISVQSKKEIDQPSRVGNVNGHPHDYDMKNYFVQRKIHDDERWFNTSFSLITMRLFFKNLCNLAWEHIMLWEQHSRGNRGWKSTELQPDIVLLDVRLQDADGISLKAVRDICPKCHVIVFTAFDGPTAIARSAAAGATAFSSRQRARMIMCCNRSYCNSCNTSPESQLKKLTTRLSKHTPALTLHSPHESFRS